MMVEFLQKQEGIASVREAGNGLEALNHLANEPVDVMITDLIMPVMDGYTLLEEMRKLELEPVPKVIAVTALGRDDFVMRAIERGVMYYMVKPFDMKHLLRHIHEVMGMSTRDTDQPLRQAMPLRQTQSLEERISSLFLTIGIPAHIKGYSFLREAVKMVVEQPDVINRITKELYPGIGKRFDTTASKVERAIRHAIEVAWSRGRIDTLNRAFGCKVCTKEDKPTNGEFIAMIADKLSMERSA
jgi:two-component system response regulator (stage 0 sporulation protein A)